MMERIEVRVGVRHEAEQASGRIAHAGHRVVRAVGIERPLQSRRAVRTEVAGATR